MVLLIHIMVAILGLVATAYCYINPNSSRFKSAYTLVALTLASGTYLVVNSSAHLVAACFSGLAYISLAGLGLYLSKLKLQKQSDK